MFDVFYSSGNDGNPVKYSHSGTALRRTHGCNLVRRIGELNGRYVVTLTPSSGAVQLYVRYLNVPSMGTVLPANIFSTSPDASDFYDTLADGSGSYSVTVPACAGDGPWYFGVYASTAPATWTITVTRTAIAQQALAFDTPLSASIGNQQWKFYYFDAPDNNSFVGVSLIDPSQTAGATALYLRPMMCPTMFQNMRAAATTGVQTATVSCTETMCVCVSRAYEFGTNSILLFLLSLLQTGAAAGLLPWVA